MVDYIGKTLKAENQYSINKKIHLKNYINFNIYHKKYNSICKYNYIFEKRKKMDLAGIYLVKQKFQLIATIFIAYKIKIKRSQCTYAKKKRWQKFFQSFSTNISLFMNLNVYFPQLEKMVFF